MSENATHAALPAGHPYSGPVVITTEIGFAISAVAELSMAILCDPLDAEHKACVRKYTHDLWSGLVSTGVPVPSFVTSLVLRALAPELPK